TGPRTQPRSGNCSPRVHHRRPSGVGAIAISVTTVGQTLGNAQPAKLKGVCHGPALPGVWSGGLPCPGNRGTVHTGAGHQATRPPGASDRADEVGQGSAGWPSAGSGAGLV